MNIEGAKKKKNIRSIHSFNEKILLSGANVPTTVVKIIKVNKFELVKLVRYRSMLV